MYQQIEPDQNRNLPALICTTCSNIVLQCFEFKKKCEQNEQILLSLTESDFLNLTLKLEEIKEEVSDDNNFQDGFGESNSFDQNTMETNDNKMNFIACDSSKVSTSNQPCHILPRELQSNKPQEKKTIPIRLFTCNECGRSYKTQQILRKHEKIHISGVEIFKCKLCDRTFETKYFLRKHYLEMHEVTSLASLVPERIPNKSRHLCNICGKVLNSLKAFEYHKLFHTGEKPFKCNDCNKTFRSKSQLILHSRVHTDQRPYLCHYCEKSFRTSQALKDHLRTHTGEKPFVCPKCGTGFAQRESMKTHMKSISRCLTNSQNRLKSSESSKILDSS